MDVQVFKAEVNYNSIVIVVKIMPVNHIIKVIFLMLIDYFGDKVDKYYKKLPKRIGKRSLVVLFLSLLLSLRSVLLSGSTIYLLKIA